MTPEQVIQFARWKEVDQVLCREIEQEWPPLIAVLCGGDDPYIIVTPKDGDPYLVLGDGPCLVLGGGPCLALGPWVLGR